MKRLWLSFVGVLIVSFLVLGWIGTRIHDEMPPIPAKVVTTSGETLIDEGEVSAGQNVWQTMGGMEVGSIWGHGSYVAPDWTADWLHREATYILGVWAKEEGADFADLPGEKQAALQARLTQLMRTNTHDAATNVVTIDPVRAAAFRDNLANYTEVFREGRAAYAIPAGAVTDEKRLHDLAAFFFWTSWAASTNRPDAAMSYTSNWPHEPLIGNRPTGENVVWTGVSIIMLLAGISAMAWWHAAKKEEEPAPTPPVSDPLAGWQATPSQRATLKYFWVVTALLFVQMLLGVIVAHYGVEGDGFYGFPLSKFLPYSVARTWHVQAGLFWIATAWLGAGLFIGPVVSGQEPKYQALGVNILFGALLLVVTGSLTGEWLSVQNKLGDVAAFYFGHQGYEYVDLGRIWQIGLMVGLLLWLVLMVRALWPALKQKGEARPLVMLLAVASAAIALFYGAGLTWGRHTHLSMVEYWRWWVVHLWVEGFFEVFATTVIAFVFMRLKLLRPGVAAGAALLSATIFLAGGIIGTCHHLYFSGSPTVALAWGSVFSALEVVPLTLVGFEANENLRLSTKTDWLRRYKWPIAFFVAVAFWNMVGAGLFGFMINPPIALYYMQGLNTTPVHGHAALFGVYGMLGIGLMLLCLRLLLGDAEWKDTLPRFGFWGMNVGLFAMCVGSLLPVGLLQTWASVDQGYWYARSSELMQTDLMQTLRWMRIPGDTIFFLGAVAIVIFVATMKRGGRPTPTAAAAKETIA